jgi:hypothetical protein
MPAIIVTFIRSSVAVAILAVLANPALAKSSSDTGSSDAPRASERSSPLCDASELGPNGSWIRIPCQEIDAGTPAKQKTSTRNDGRNENEESH